MNDLGYIIIDGCVCEYNFFSYHSFDAEFLKDIMSALKELYLLCRDSVAFSNHAKLSAINNMMNSIAERSECSLNIKLFPQETLRQFCRAAKRGEKRCESEHGKESYLAFFNCMAEGLNND